MADNSNSNLRNDRRIWDLTQLFAPSDCLGCGRALAAPVCEACLTGLEPIAGKGCRRCNNPEVHDQTLDCEWCRRLDFLPDQICALFAYRGVGRELFQAFKFGGYWRLVGPLAGQGLGSILKTLSCLDFEALVPIPETLSRKWKRSFNPAGEMARWLSDRTSLPVKQVLKARFGGRRQVGLPYSDRRLNIDNRFRISTHNLPHSLILVDDVLTTGATLEAATRVLRAAGVGRIAWFTLFRTL